VAHKRSVECPPLTVLCGVSEREAEILKPLSSVEVVEKEEANFDTEITEDDVVGEWKLRGQVLMRSPVRSHGVRQQMRNVQIHLFGS